MMSVLILCHKRKEFIIDAIDSVLHQTVPRDNYEVVVVKSFRDEKIDSYISSNNVKNIYTNEETLGAKCVVGIKECSYDKIAFLEDDDLFYEGKMERINTVLANVDFTYYHNNYVVTDGEGRELAWRPYSTPTKIRIVNKSTISHSTISKLLNEGASFNLSCIVVDKRAISKHLDELKEINVAVDNFMFFISLESGGTIYVDEDVLTAYRVHTSNDSIATTGSIDEAFDKSTSFLKRDIKGYEAILSVIEDNLLRETVECRVKAPTINLALIDRNNSELKFKDCIMALRCGIRFRYRALILLSLSGFLSLLIPGAGKKLYTFYIKRRKRILGRMKALKPDFPN
ncbi:MAG: glycosyltransferase family A protein [Candidatus Parvarchaeota archaeon]